MTADLCGCYSMFSWLLISVSAGLCFLLKSSPQAKPLLSCHAQTQILDYSKLVAIKQGM